MILTTHALTGAVIGKSLGSPWLILLTALTSHYLLDTLRHGEYISDKPKFREYWKVATDLSIGGLVIIFYIYLAAPPAEKIFHIFLGMLFSMLPDFFVFLGWFIKSKTLEKIFKIHAWFHRYPLGSKEREWGPRNALNDILVSLVATLFLFF